MEGTRGGAHEPKATEAGTGTRGPSATERGTAETTGGIERREPATGTPGPEKFRAHHLEKQSKPDEKEE